MDVEPPSPYPSNYEMRSLIFTILIAVSIESPIETASADTLALGSIDSSLFEDPHYFRLTVASNQWRLIMSASPEMTNTTMATLPPNRSESAWSGETMYHVSYGESSVSATIGANPWPRNGAGVPQAIWYGLTLQINPSLFTSSLPNLNDLSFVTGDIRRYTRIEIEPEFPAAGNRVRFFQDVERKFPFNGIEEIEFARLISNESAILDSKDVPTQFEFQPLDPTGRPQNPVRIQVGALLSTNVSIKIPPELPDQLIRFNDYRFGPGETKFARYTTNRWLAPQEALAIPSVAVELATQARLGAQPAQSGPNHIQILFFVVPTFLFILGIVVLIMVWKSRHASGKTRD